MSWHGNWRRPVQICALPRSDGRCGAAHERFGRWPDCLCCNVDHPELAGGKQVIKALFDRMAAGLALILLAPLFLPSHVTIRLDDRGPVFFRQTRIGLDGQPFRLYKFRTMVVDAEQRKARA